MPIARTKLILSHVAVAIVSAVATLAAVLFVMARHPTAADMRAIETYAGSQRCFGNARIGHMSSAENALFEKLRKQCAAGKAEELNSLLAVDPKSLSVTCINDGERYREPTRPVMKLAVKNISSHSVRLLEPEVAKIGWSTEPRNGLWTLDYLVSDKTSASWVHILNPGQELVIAGSVAPEGYGKQNVSIVFMTPVWTSISRQSTSKTTKTIYRGKCEYEWDPT